MKHLDIARLSSLWTRQFHSEFRDICWNYNIDLMHPVFEISTSEKQLGSWQAENRVIKISYFLIINYSWAVTLNVLKHEIAHQICSEILASNEVSHGPAFNHACDLLGLQEEYRRASGDLPEEVEHFSKGSIPNSEGRQFIEKVEKLLALAKSSNENEAALAMQKANELMAKYNVLQLNGKYKLCYASLIINKKKKRIESYQRRICAILTSFFFVKIVTSYLYDPFSDQTHKTIEILGTQENITIGEYCYYFLENQLAALWEQNRYKYGGKTRTEKNSYYLGLLNGFQKKLNAQKISLREKKCHNLKQNGDQDTMSHALITIEDERLNEYVRTRFPRLRSIRRSGPTIYRSTYDEGVETGKKITFHKGVSQKDGNKGNLLAMKY